MKATIDVSNEIFDISVTADKAAALAEVMYDDFFSQRQENMNAEYWTSQYDSVSTLYNLLFSLVKETQQRLDTLENGVSIIKKSEI